METEKMIEEMAKVIRPILENRTDIGYIPDLDKPIAEALVEKYQPKIPEGAVVLTREEQNKILEATEYRLNQLRTRIAVKENDIGELESEIDDLKTELKQARKETAREILKEIDKELYKTSRIYLEAVIKDSKNYDAMDKYGVMTIAHDILVKIAEQFGIEIKE